MIEEEAQAWSLGVVFLDARYSPDLVIGDSR